MGNFLNYIYGLDNFWFYSVLFVSAFMENILPPLPGDSVTVFGAYLVGKGRLSFIMTYIMTTAGSLAGFIVYYYVGRYIGKRFFEKESKYRPSLDNFGRIEQWYGKYGYGIIIANRFLSGFRSIISVFSGITKLNSLLTFICALISCLLWNGLLIWLGMLLGEKWEGIITYIKQYNIIAFSILIVGVVLVVLVKYLRNKGKTNGN